MATEEEPLDLYDIAVLLNYERNTTEPRLRHTKLREVAFLPRRETPNSRSQESRRPRLESKCMYVDSGRPMAAGQTKCPQPTYRVPTISVASTMANEQLETIFHQARNHDGSYQAIGLVQLFFKLFPKDTKLRNRHAPINKQRGVSYVTTTSRRVIVEEAFQIPNSPPQFVSFRRARFTSVVMNRS